MKLMVVSLMAASALLATECTLEKTGPVSVAWTAFKTPAKAGVKGTFDNIEYKGAKQAASVTDLLKGSEVEITTAKVNSGNEGRDAKLVTFFFDVMKEKKIEAKVLEVSGDFEKGKLLIEVEMNGVEKKVPMSYTVEKGRLNANGVIDLSDFKALKALASINEACFELHQGKTWQDVEIGFGFDLSKTCK